MILSSLSDSDLWSLIVSDNYRAFAVLYERHWFRLYKTAKKYINDNEICEEAIHDLFVNIWRRKDYLNIIDFNTYFKVAIRHQVYAYLKKTRTLHVEYREDIKMEAVGFEFNKGQEKMLYAELEDQVTEQLSALPERCRQIFLLSRKEHLSNIEIAEKLSISKRSVENQITVALKHLRLSFKNITTLMLIVLLHK